MPAQTAAAEIQGCTVGVVHVPGGILFFKNRDLAGEYIRDRLTVVQSTPDLHVLKGLNLRSREIEGVAIGVSRHRICVADTHVAFTSGVTYNLLCERLMQQAQDKEDVPRLVGDFMARHTLQGGIILVASPAWAFLVEVFEDQYQIQEVAGNFVVTNHFSLLPQPEGRPEGRSERRPLRLESSLSRLQVARSMIEAISDIRSLKSMLRSHVPEKGELSICNHRQDGGGTESSCIIQIQGEYVGWSYLIGAPCENDYQTVQLFP